MALARAQLKAGDTDLTFSIRPYTANWDYTQNTASQDTIGGRVVQLLSVQLSGLQITSVAGSRRELQRIAEQVRHVMNYHVDTSLPAVFTVPSRGWKFRVYVTAMPQIGWQVTTVSYPYQLSMSVVEDLTGVKSHQILQNELARLAEGIGYNPAVHGGDAAGFQALVKSVLAAKATTEGAPGGGTTGTGTQTGPTSGQFQGKGLWAPKIANSPWTGKTLQDQIFNVWAGAFGSSVGHDALCIAQRESGFHPDALNSYNLGGFHYVYGLFQISDVHNTVNWWPKSGVSGPNGGLMFNAEYNCRCAMQIYSQQGWGPWSTAPQCGL